MSVINKTPFINTLLGSLSDEELTTLFQCVNGQGPDPIFRTLKSWGSDILTSSDKGIYPIKLEMNGPAALTYDGYLVYTDSACVLIAYSGENNAMLNMINITMPASGSDINWELVNETLSVCELRSNLFDAAHGSGGGGGGSGSDYILVSLESIPNYNQQINLLQWPQDDFDEIFGQLVEYLRGACAKPSNGNDNYGFIDFPTAKQIKFSWFRHKGLVDYSYCRNLTVNASSQYYENEDQTVFLFKLDSIEDKDDPYHVQMGVVFGLDSNDGFGLWQASLYVSVSEE